MSSSIATERAVLRKRLQAHREQLSRRLDDNKESSRKKSTNVLFQHSDTFPRSITMRLLTNRQHFVLLAVAELFPLVVRHLLKNAQQRERNNAREELNV